MKRTPAIGFIFLTLLIDVTGLGIIIPVMPALITQLTGGTISDAAEYGGWMLFAFSVMQFLFSPLLGSLSDQFGRRPVLLVALFGFGLDYILMALAPTIAWLFVGRIIAGITGASFTTAMAYIADISTPEKKAQNFGMVGAAFGVGFIVGPVIGGLLGEYGPRVPFYFAAALTFLNWIYGFFILPESLPVEKRRKFDWKRANPIGTLKHLKKYPLVLSLVGALVFVYIASHAVQSTWAFFTIERFAWSESMVGYSLGFAGLMVGLVQGVLIRFINPKLGPEKSVYTGMILYIIGLMLFAFATQGWMMFVFLIPYCLGGITGPAIQGIMSNQVPDTEQGELQGGLASMISLTSIIGPPLMTLLFSWFSSGKAGIIFPGAAFFAGAVFSMASLFFAYKAMRRMRN
ncbi:MAG: TCR/Tet family MFS transporter [Bacteroidetes bacterium]|nr:TCR/Tet family MFS transporter [Bacteroidota bacterium]